MIHQLRVLFAEKTYPQMGNTSVATAKLFLIVVESAKVFTGREDISMYVAKAISFLETYVCVMKVFTIRVGAFV